MAASDPSPDLGASIPSGDALDRYVRNAWYVASWSQDVPPGATLGVRILNEPIVLWRSIAGTVSAFEDRCLHRLAPLSLGRCEGETLRCVYHGFLYDKKGYLVDVPGQRIGTDSLRLKTYSTFEINDWIWVWMGTGPPDESLIPEVLVPNPQEYAFGRGTMDFSAEARLLNENLLDLSHTSFLHRESFGVSETWARESPETSVQSRSVRTERWIRSEGVAGAVDVVARVDTYHRYDFFVPGMMLMATRTYPEGTADSLGGVTPDLSRLPDSYTSQAVTPVTDKTTRYFYLLAQRRSGTERFFDMRIAEKAFGEDRAMIEAQQRRIDDVPKRRFISTQADKGVVLYNRLLDALRSEELKSGALGNAPRRA